LRAYAYRSEHLCAHLHACIWWLCVRACGVAAVVCCVSLRWARQAKDADDADEVNLTG